MSQRLGTVCNLLKLALSCRIVQYNKYLSSWFITNNQEIVNVKLSQIYGGYSYRIGLSRV